MRLEQLADRAEAANGPDRELDEAIFGALGIVPSREHGLIYPHYAYTASLDAAMSVAPEGWRIGTLGEHAAEPVFGAVLMPRVGRADCQKGRGSSFALALTAASLRARSRDTE